jgi:phosphoadenosine phosphosulfate reductase
MPLALDLFVTLDDLIAESIELLREHEPPEGYYGCFSGGKDSIVIKELARRSGVRVVWHYNITTIDPPELFRFICQEHPGVIREPPRRGSFFRRMEEVKGFPTRRARWCCEEYKETTAPKGSTLILGIRAEESAARAKGWSSVTIHRKTKAPAIQPIIGWASDEIWEFIRGERLPYPSLYDEGFHRLGCIGCPMARESGRRYEFARWPAYERRWRLAFRRIWDRRAGTIQRDGREWFGSARFDSWEAMWEWWIADVSLPPVDDPAQEVLF